MTAPPRDKSKFPGSGSMNTTTSPWHPLPMPKIRSSSAGLKRISVVSPVAMTLMARSTMSASRQPPLIAHDLVLAEDASGRGVGQVAQEAAGRTSVDAVGRDPAEGGAELARRSRGTPRIANRLLRRVRDYAEVRDATVIDAALATGALADAKLDLCAHCLPHDAAAWQRITRELGDQVARCAAGLRRLGVGRRAFLVSALYAGAADRQRVDPTEITTNA